MRTKSVCLAPSLLTRSSFICPCADTEPFDEGFDRHIWSLSDQSLRWDLQIARERRTKPEEIEKQMQELLAAQKELDAEEAAELEDIRDDETTARDDSAYLATILFLTRCSLYASSSRCVRAHRRGRFANICPSGGAETGA